MGIALSGLIVEANNFLVRSLLSANFRVDLPGWRSPVCPLFPVKPMSKFNKTRVQRIVTPAASRLSPAESVNLMLAPRLHLEMLISQEALNSYYLISVVGVFNVATALAYLYKDKRSIALYESVQRTVLAMAREGADSTENREHLRRVFNIAEAYILAQRKTDVLRAINLVEYQIKHGEGSTLLPLDV